MVVSLTVNLEFGYTGVPNFGKVLFVSVGGLISGSLAYRLALYVMNLKAKDVIASQAYLITVVNQNLQSNPLLGLELFLFSLAVAAGTAAVVGYAASFPAIKLREDYLGMLLLAAGQFFFVFDAAFYPINGGTTGLPVPDPLAWAVPTLGLRDFVVLGILGLVTAVVYLYSERVARSPLGRMMRAVRDNEVSSDAVGKDIVAVKRNVLVIASALSGIAGVLFVLWLPFLSNLTFQRTEWTFFPFVIVILGGAANNAGVGVGTAVFVAITEGVDQARTCILVNNISLPVDINALEPIFIGVLLLVVLLWRPKGLIPEKPTFTIEKSKLQEIMERVNATLKAPARPSPTEKAKEEIVARIAEKDPSANSSSSADGPPREKSPDSF